MHHLKALRYDPCVTRGSHILPATHTRTIPAFTPHPQDVTALWLVLIAPTHEGMAELTVSQSRISDCTVRCSSC